MLGAGKVMRVGGFNLSTLNSSLLGNQQSGLKPLLKSIFSNGEQGFSYDPNDLTAEKINWRRNLLLYTQSFTNNIYTKPDASLTVGGFAPDGTATATKVIPNAVNTSYHGVYCIISDSMQVGKVYTASVYAKAAEYGVIRLSDTANASFGMLFDLRNGTLSNDANASKAVNMTGAIEAVGNGWYRCSIQFTAIGQPPAINTTRVLNVGVFDAAIAPYAGNGVSGLHIWGMQLEAGSLTPYQALTDFNMEFMKAFPLHTLYQDAAGTIPVTAAGQPVGLVLDKSQGLMLGNEIISGGNFEGGLILTKIDEPSAISTWTLNTNNPISGLQDGLLSVTQAAASRPALYAPSPQSKQGAYEEVSFDYKVISGSVNVSGIYIGGGVVVINKALSGTGRFTYRYLRTETGTGIYIYFGNTLGNVQIDNISVKQILGNHAYQTVSASRPILQQTPILGSELVVNGDTSNGTDGWVTTNATLNTIDGSFVMTASSQYGGVTKAISLDTSKTYELTFTVTGNTTNAPLSAVIRPSLTTINYASVSIIAAGKYQLIFKPTEVSSRFMLQHGNAAPTGSLTFDNVSIKEITGYRTDQNYLEFDGVDDSLYGTPVIPNGTILRAIPNVGTEIRFNQELPLNYLDNRNHAGLVTVGRNLSSYELVKAALELEKRTGVRSLDTSVVQTFANGEQGFVYDPNDLTTLYQDAAGTIPVTATGQPVGLMLDKSAGLVLSGEKWEHTLTIVSGGTSILATNTYRIYSPEGSISQVSCPTGTVGKWYEISVTIDSIVSGAVTTDFGGSPVWNTVGVKKFKVYLTNTVLTFKRSGITDAQISNISAKELAGNHAYQTVSASRPILQLDVTTGAYYLEFDGVDDRLRTSSFPSMGSATSVFIGSQGDKLATAAIVARGVGGYVYQTSGQVTVQSVNNPITVLASGKTVITVKYAASGTGVALKVNNVSSTNPATMDRGFTTSYPLMIGAFDTNGAVPYLGRIYSLIGIARITTDSETLALEKAIAKNTGVSLNV